MDSETIKTENVSVDELIKTPFPPVSENVIKQFSENGGNAPENGNNGDLEGYNPDVHESPPRKNKRGEWAKKRGNKKGFFAKPKTETAPQINLPPENPAPAENETENAAAENAALEISTEQAAGLISGMFYFGLEKFSDYDAPEKERAAHKQAAYEYLMYRGGVELPPWGALAAVSAQSILAACAQPKAKTRFQKFKEWLVLKIYAFRNRKNEAPQPNAQA